MRPIVIAAVLSLLLMTAVFLVTRGCESEERRSSTLVETTNTIGHPKLEGASLAPAPLPLKTPTLVVGEDAINAGEGAAKLSEITINAVWGRSDRPVIGASVWVAGLPGTVVKTDAVGIARMAVPQGHEGQFMGRTSEGVWATTVLDPTQSKVDLRFDDAVVLSGVTVDLAGAPVGGVSLLLRGFGAEEERSAASAPSYESRSERRRIRSDDLGRFSVVGLPPGMISLVGVDAGVRVMAASGVLFVPVPAGSDIRVAIERVSRVPVRVIDHVTREPVAPPVAVELSGPIGNVTGVTEFGPSGEVVMYLPTRVYSTGSLVRTTARARGYSAQDSTGVVPESGPIELLLRRDKANLDAGSIDMRIPAEFRRPQAWRSVSLARLGMSADDNEVVIHEEPGHWRIIDVPAGDYDVYFMGSTIGRQIRVSAGSVTATDAEVSGFVSLKLRPTRGGKALAGSFNVNVAPVGLGSMGAWTVETDEGGDLTLGSFPPGPVVLVQLMRSTERLADAMRIVLESGSPIRRVEAELVGW